MVPERRNEGGRDAGALGEPSVREPRSDLRVPLHLPEGDRAAPRNVVWTF